MQLKIEINYDPKFYDLELEVHPANTKEDLIGRGIKKLYIEVEPG
jgi:hypothetical protein